MLVRKLLKHSDFNSGSANKNGTKKNSQTMIYVLGNTDAVYAEYTSMSIEAEDIIGSAVTKFFIRRPTAFL
jgi:hypothetical protein